MLPKRECYVNLGPRVRGNGAGNPFFAKKFEKNFWGEKRVKSRLLEKKEKFLKKF